MAKLLLTRVDTKVYTYNGSCMFKNFQGKKNIDKLDNDVNYTNN